MAKMTIIDELAKQVYLGDGVYAHHDGYQVWLIALGGNHIALEPGVMQALENYYRDVRKKMRDHSEGLTIEEDT